MRILRILKDLCLFQGWIFIAAAVIICWQSVRTIAWPTTEGTVSRSYVAYQEVMGKTWYWPKVWYDYEVEDRKLSAENIAFFGMAPFGARIFPTWEEANVVLQSQYAEERTVTVRYNPSNPLNAFLVVRVMSADFIFVLVAGIILLLAGWLCTLTLRGKTQPVIATRQVRRS
ncbi:hypothetical protein COU78_05470 [Candidatus Peregrinibacteria bacterium CG10_big_fil_rev_8_21_14_0_10_49_24]|nr:MAG: hypothetical protein COV83_03255 [Candidatus Peregrinibacteria bacterium CG11_big_fil_rev_8_21_14_0_20_49_14]PIR50577.1 MAG: hypothetical protein COU78_05470 [Candidatus Peregrinibacteria bacterium CG10_big_fil_rev_8_21_14_0_10_49_24]PJA67104.1 MAG: hypothetical protein CO157_06635 [Candidatus Peregrinibacteria bacterium CG_4_9_14_3_um_filter_49_12]